MKWQKVFVDSISEIVTKGTTPTSIGFDFSQEGIPFLRINNIQNGVINLDDVLFIDSKTDQALSRSRIQGQDVLLSIAGTIGKTVVVPSDFKPINCNQAIAIIRLKNCVDPHYFCYWLQTNDAFKQINGSKVTGTISNLSLGCIKSLQIPLPPIAEQKRIAAILDKADAIRRKRQEAIKLTEELGRSLFLDMFGDPVTNPKGWEITTLDQVIELITYGLTVRPKYLDSGIPLISGTQIRNGVVNLETAPRISDKDYKDLSSKCKPKKGDILFAKTGSIGHCAIWNLNEDIAIAQNIARITFLPNKVKSLFALNYLRSSFIQQLAQNRAKGNAVQDLQLGEMKKFPFPLVPIEKQELFIHAYNKKEALLIKNSVSNLESENLFNALLQRAFKGEL